MKREATYMHVAQAHTHTYGHTNSICITHVDGCEHFKIALAVLTDKEYLKECWDFDCDCSECK